MRLHIKGTLQVPDGTPLKEAILRLAIRLRQFAENPDLGYIDWQGTVWLDKSDGKNP